jgi:glycosyltransferase involved in cell wall biosynthesis/GT2 family glycosyltransferase
MPAPKSISIHMPTYQGMEFLERVIPALLEQKCSLPWDFYAIDSGSTDGTWQYLQDQASSAQVPFQLERIHSVEFDHGDTRNLMASRTRGELLVFLTQDAIPAGPDWLETLVRNFEDEGVGAAYCRNVPRPDAHRATKILSAGDPGYAEERTVQQAPPEGVQLSPDEQRLLYNFNDVASAVRRDLWVRHPFPRTNFGEDILMARALIEAGFKVIYDAEATVEHSHDYSPEQMWARGEIDGRFNAEWLDRVAIGSQNDVEFLLKRLSGEDGQAVEALALPSDEASALKTELGQLRRSVFEGLLQGGQSKPRHAKSSLRSTGHLKLLYVVHGFPPETWAGTEIYTLNLARGMQDLGHEVTVLTRSPGKAGQENFSVHEDEFEGLRVLRMVNHLAHRSLRDSYTDERAEQVFSRILAEVQPNLVHFQHMIHSSIGNVQLAKDAGCATVATCHDYWGLCARVQMIRPDRQICPHSMGAGCFACIKDKDSAAIESMERKNPSILEAGARLGAWLLGPNKKRGRQAGEFLEMQRRNREVMAAYGACDLRISPSRFLRQMYLDNGDFDAHRFLFSDNGMRTDHVQSVSKVRKAGDPIRFGFVGSLVWYKGGETMIRAMQHLKGKGALLNVYGTFEPDKDEHHAQLQGLAKDCNVTFHGRFDNSKLAEVYAEIDVLIVPSVWYENAPITIHEAHLTGTPVLTSNIGGMAEFVRDGVDGVHFEVGDDRDLAAKMEEFIQAPQRLVELAQDFPQLKTLDQNVEETESRYRALVATDRPKAQRAAPLSWRGNQHKASGGGVEVQGEDIALLRPGGWVEYALPGGDQDTRGQVVISLRFLAEEPDLEQGGRIFFGDQGVASLITRTGQGQSLEHRIVVDWHGAYHQNVLRVETLLFEGGPSAHLRIEQITWQGLNLP